MDSSKSDQPKPPESSTTPPAEGDDENSLENPSGGQANATSGSSSIDPKTPLPKKQGGLKAKLKQFNLYLLLFVFMIIIAAAVVVIGYLQSQQANTSNNTITTQKLTQSTLDKVASSDASVGNTSEVLNVDSSAVFAGQVLVRNDLQVAGSLEIGGTVALTNLTVGGTTSLGQLNVSKNLALTGNAAIQGAVAIAQSLAVNGPATFNSSVSASQITTSNLQLNSNLIITHHISAGGATPGHTAGPAVGDGGTATVGGSDTSGSVTVNIGSNPQAGCFISVTFSQAFDETPHVVLTPVGLAAGGLAYYVDRTSTGFSVCDATTPPSGSSFAFDYFIVE
jgi:cytoskeletal protein CcmA (bactofilin family)